VQLQYDAETERFRAELDAWLDEHLALLTEIRDRPPSSAHVPEWARQWQRSLFDAGWLVPGWPPELGGRNATPVQQMVYFEELARRQIPRTYNIQGLSIFAPSVIDFGTEQQKEQWALPVLRADKTTCLGMSEPSAGSDLASLSTRAEMRGDHFVINGQKVWTSGAHHADFCICFVRTDPTAPKHKGISVVLVDMSTPGITVRPLPGLVHRTLWVDFNEVFFDNVIVPAENLLGDLNDGWRIANASLAHERGMLWVWESARLDHTLELAVAEARRTGDGGSHISAKSSLREVLADAYVDALALRCLGYRGFSKFAQGKPSPEHILLKLFGSEANQKLMLGFTDGLGAAALDVETPEDADRMGDTWPWVSRYLGSFGTTISGGTSEIQRNIIAERLLGLPR
jgi:alkylation response protein AidB-like acyl-CoA dehydrogenase